jgi:hypothetical protein
MESIHQQLRKLRRYLVFEDRASPELRLPYLAELVDLMPTVLSLLSFRSDHVQEMI